MTARVQAVREAARITSVVPVQLSADSRCIEYPDDRNRLLIVAELSLTNSPMTFR